MYNGSGVQQPLPSMLTDTSVLYFAVVPNNGSQWKQQKSVEFMRPDSVNVPGTIDAGGTAQPIEGDPAGIILNHLDFIQPIYPGAAPPTYASGVWSPASGYTQFTINAITYFVMNGYLYVSTVEGQSAATFIGTAAFPTVKGKTVADGAITWMCLGKAGLVRFSFSNLSASTQSPAAQSYELFQL